MVRAHTFHKYAAIWVLLSIVDISGLVLLAVAELIAFVIVTWRISFDNISGVSCVINFLSNDVSFLL